MTERQLAILRAIANATYGIPVALINGLNSRGVLRGRAAATAVAALVGKGMIAKQYVEPMGQVYVATFAGRAALAPSFASTEESGHE